VLDEGEYVVEKVWEGGEVIHDLKIVEIGDRRYSFHLICGAAGPKAPPILGG